MKISEGGFGRPVSRAVAATTTVSRFTFYRDVAKQPPSSIRWTPRGPIRERDELREKIDRSRSIVQDLDGRSMMREDQ